MSGFLFDLPAQYSYDGEAWTDFSGILFGPVSTTGNFLSTPHTTRTDFGMCMPFRVGTYGTTGGELATVSMKAAIKFWT